MRIVLNLSPKARELIDEISRECGEADSAVIDNERFESTRRPGWILSHSTYRDENCVVRWRTVGKHHDTQQRGRALSIRLSHQSP